MFGNKRNVKFNNNTPTKKMSYSEYVKTRQSSSSTTKTVRSSRPRKPCNCGKGLLKR